MSARSARSLLGKVRFPRGSGLLLSCVTSESVASGNDATLNSIIGFRSRSLFTEKAVTGRVSTGRSPCLESLNIPKNNYRCCQPCNYIPDTTGNFKVKKVDSGKYSRTVLDCLSIRHYLGDVLPSAPACVIATRWKYTNSRRQSSNTIQCKSARAKKTKKKIVKAQKRMKAKYEQIEERVRLKAEELEDKVKGMKENIFTIPNLLTTSRIAATPLLGYLVLNEYFGLATCLFGLAGLTDLLDGYIARAYPSQQSVLGSIIDPLADKVLVGVLTVTMTMVGLIPIPLTIIIVGRDALIVSYSFYLRYKSLPSPVTLRRYFDMTYATVKLKPLLISKVNTNVQLIMLAVSLAAPVFNYTDHAYLHGLWYLTAGTTLISGMTYIFAKDTFKILSKKK
ncbi:probable cardiolipin synthase (CMP-forming) [Ptychodera flava]|uniref:probable cardiolipin synthase (CMP-forming) n=1 Tax=Ptychodera flava TaxID=63121 RepID=UPI00396A10C2